MIMGRPYTTRRHDGKQYVKQAGVTAPRQADMLAGRHAGSTTRLQSDPRA
jgi:hypothetical protein